ncbi:hypothetical protein TRFO_18385 [Tritrichomonas foetus]|uniref:Initiator binding domain-containing protein n=1 Tax=Tritrichomonas foetus TaxID=1144522 RepID=A0A1J4KKU0_9EUKA|nr:hypothetical protein TRFO_18385 [Tritrichomonas foetus]|eukprot:OHT11921.1 hypothetical protein TRFO_18385 [Tritrichomonas foetus]
MKSLFSQKLYMREIYQKVRQKLCSNFFFQKLSMISHCISQIGLNSAANCICSPVSSSGLDTVKLLPIEERSQYQSLIDNISNDVQKTRRHSGLAEFVKHISLVHKFVLQGNSNDSLRGVVCGVEFGRGFILVNTDRLKKVLYRSKSCMNGCFQRLGYDVMRPSHDLVCLFTRLLPNVNPEFFAIRQWCVRLVSDQCTLCFVSNLPDSIASNFEAHRIPANRSYLEAQKNIIIDQQKQSLNSAKCISNNFNNYAKNFTNSFNNNFNNFTQNSNFNQNFCNNNNLIFHNYLVNYSNNFNNHSHNYNSNNIVVSFTNNVEYSKDADSDSDVQINNAKIVEKQKPKLQQQCESQYEFLCDIRSLLNHQTISLK